MEKKEQRHALNVLRRYWGYEEFRPLQKQIIEGVLKGENVIALLPTGGGKSLCYQVPALLLEGLTLVISPLIALMEDQVNRLNSLGIKAEYIHSGKDFRYIDRVLDNCIFGDIKLLYVSPERLNNEVFIQRIKQVSISLIAVDEAHCISQWGHDFRPSYRMIGEFTGFFPESKKLALTATATRGVIEEIQEYLALVNPIVFATSFMRDNIFLDVMKTENGLGELKKRCRALAGKAIVYVRSRRQVEMIAGMLVNEGLRARFFHAGLDYHVKQDIQGKFQQGEIAIMVATNAFGMGIDIPDIEKVIHIGIPPSIEEYYQEVGRAGRDGRDAEATLIYSDRDKIAMQDNFLIDFPSLEDLAVFYRRLCVYYGIEVGEGEGKVRSFDLLPLSKKFRMKPKEVNGSIKALKALGLVTSMEETSEKALIKIIATPREMRDHMNEGTIEGKLVDQLLRSYPGIFDNWIESDIQVLSKKLGTPLESVIYNLNHLRQQGLIQWFSQSAGPKVVFLQSRVPQKDMVDFKSNYSHLFELKQKRMHGMLEYLQSSNCRYRYILDYFNEELKSNCGHCDNCCQVAAQLSDHEIKNLDGQGLKELIESAQRSGNKDLIKRIQRMHSEGLIVLPNHILQ